MLEEQSTHDRAAADPTPDLDQLPGLQAAIDVLDQRDPATDFDYGLHALIAGITSPPHHRSEAPSSPTEPEPVRGHI